MLIKPNEPKAGRMKRKSLVFIKMFKPYSGSIPAAKNEPAIEPAPVPLT